jgi:hypothetical protein
MPLVQSVKGVDSSPLFLYNKVAKFLIADVTITVFINNIKDLFRLLMSKFKPQRICSYYEIIET